MYICPHMLCVPILPMYLLSVSVYSCIIFIWDMKQTDEGGRGEVSNFEVIILLTTYFFKKKTLKMLPKCAQESMILTYHIFFVLNP